MILKKAKLLLADTLEQIGYQCESGVWRNFFLMGTQELREGIQKQTVSTSNISFIRGLTLEMCFDSIAINLDPKKSEGKAFTIYWNFTDKETNIVAVVSIDNCAMNYLEKKLNENFHPIVNLERETFNQILARQLKIKDAVEKGKLTSDDPGALVRVIELFALLDNKKDPFFPIITPQTDENITHQQKHPILSHLHIL